MAIVPPPSPPQPTPLNPHANIFLIGKKSFFITTGIFPSLLVLSFSLPLPETPLSVPCFHECGISAYLQWWPEQRRASESEREAKQASDTWQRSPETRRSEIGVRISEWVSERDSGRARGHFSVTWRLKNGVWHFKKGKIRLIPRLYRESKSIHLFPVSESYTFVAGCF